MSTSPGFGLRVNALQIKTTIFHCIVNYFTNCAP